MLSDGERRQLDRIESELAAAHPGLARRLAGKRTPRLPVAALIAGVIGLLVLTPLSAVNLGSSVVVATISMALILYALFRLPSGVDS